MDILGAAPFVVVTAVVTWAGNAWRYRGQQKKEALEHGDRLEVHRDELTFELLSAARIEMTAARAEVDELREETRKLRALEQHFYHFQQSLDHIESLLNAGDATARKDAEKNARAFLNRMRRMQEAKGTIRNEAQAIDSAVAMAERQGGIIELDKDKPL